MGNVYPHAGRPPPIRVVGVPLLGISLHPPHALANPPQKNPARKLAKSLYTKIFLAFSLPRNLTKPPNSVPVGRRDLPARKNRTFSRHLMPHSRAFVRRSAL